jgi:hypothetical protein
MARKIQVLLTCDFDEDDTPAVDTVSFAYNGATYAFEACQAHLDDFHAVMDGFVARARREGPAPRGGRSVSAPSASARPGKTPAGSGREDLSAVRAWARAQGYQVSDRGRIPAQIRDAYELAVTG